MRHVSIRIVGEVAPLEHYREHKRYRYGGRRPKRWSKTYTKKTHTCDW